MCNACMCTFMCVHSGLGMLACMCDMSVIIHNKVRTS